MHYKEFLFKEFNIFLNFNGEYYMSSLVNFIIIIIISKIKRNKS